MRVRTLSEQQSKRSYPFPSGRLSVIMLVVTVLAVTGCVVQRGAADARRAPATLHDSWLRKHPPVAGPTAIDRRSPNWTTFIWVSTDDQLCIATVGPAGSGHDGLTCAAAPTTLLTEGPAGLASKPLPQAVPHEADKALLVGAVRGRVATVDVTLFDATVTSRVVMLPTKSHRLVGAYAAWMPMRGHDELSWADITKVVARDKHKRPLDQIT